MSWNSKECELELMISRLERRVDELADWISKVDFKMAKDMEVMRDLINSEKVDA